MARTKSAQRGTNRHQLNNDGFTKRAGGLRDIGEDQPESAPPHWLWLLGGYRLVLVVFAVLVDLAIPDHQPDATVQGFSSVEETNKFQTKQLEADGSSLESGNNNSSITATSDELLFLKAFTRWDAARFLNLSVNGYRLAEDFAFFPLFPFLIRTSGYILPFSTFSTSSGIVFRAVLLSNVCFLASAWLLRRASVAVFRRTILLSRRQIDFAASESNVQNHIDCKAQMRISSGSRTARTDELRKERAAKSSKSPRKRLVRPRSTDSTSSAGGTVSVRDFREDKKHNDLNSSSPQFVQLASQQLDRCFTDSESLADKVVLAYAVNPATVFFLTSYSESLFACLFFGAVCVLEDSEGKEEYSSNASSRSVVGGDSHNGKSESSNSANKVEKQQTVTSAYSRLYFCRSLIAAGCCLTLASMARANGFVAALSLLLLDSRASPFLPIARTLLKCIGGADNTTSRSDYKLHDESGRGVTGVANLRLLRQFWQVCQWSLLWSCRFVIFLSVCCPFLIWQVIGFMQVCGKHTEYHYGRIMPVDDPVSDRKKLTTVITNNFIGGSVVCGTSSQTDDVTNNNISRGLAATSQQCFPSVDESIKHNISFETLGAWCHESSHGMDFLLKWLPQRLGIADTTNETTNDNNVNNNTGGDPSIAVPWWRLPGLRPSLYSFVQDHIWGLGFLRYWQWKQLPNFLLAFPMLVTTLVGVCCTDFVGLLNRRRLSEVQVAEEVQVQKRGTTTGKTTKTKSQNNTESRATKKIAAAATCKSSTSSTVYIVLADGLNLLEDNPFLKYQIYWGVLTVFIFLTAHVQVVTRLVCASCPALYWLVALHSPPEGDLSTLIAKFASKMGVIVSSSRGSYSGSQTEKNNTMEDNTKYPIWTFYFVWGLAYTLLGILLHCNHLPWT